MTRNNKRIEPRLRSLLAISLGIHVVLYYLLATFHFTIPNFREEPVCYVDITNLPVASPRHGTAAPAAASAPQRTTEPEMKQPSLPTPKTSPQPAAKPVTTAAKPAETAQDFEKRMARIAQDVGARHTDSAIEALQKKMAAAGSKEPQGMPTGTGTQSGSSYAAYIQSRLADAFRETIAYESGNPQTAVLLTIDQNGRLIGQKIVRSSKDQLFENAVRRAISLASSHFPPSPDGKHHEICFVFRPQGVGVGKK